MFNSDLLIVEFYHEDQVLGLTYCKSPTKNQYDCPLKY